MRRTTVSDSEEEAATPPLASNSTRKLRQVNSDEDDVVVVPTVDPNSVPLGELKPTQAHKAGKKRVLSDAEEEDVIVIDDRRSASPPAKRTTAQVKSWNTSPPSLTTLSPTRLPEYDPYGSSTSPPPRNSPSPLQSSEGDPFDHMTEEQIAALLPDYLRPSGDFQTKLSKLSCPQSEADNGEGVSRSNDESGPFYVDDENDRYGNDLSSATDYVPPGTAFNPYFIEDTPTLATFLASSTYLPKPVIRYSNVPDTVFSVKESQEVAANVSLLDRSVIRQLHKAMTSGTVLANIEEVSTADIECHEFKSHQCGLRRLLPGGWLNDKVINCYLHLLRLYIHSQPLLARSVVIHTTFAYTMFVDPTQRGRKFSLPNVHSSLAYRSTRTLPFGVYAEEKDKMTKFDNAAKGTLSGAVSSSTKSQLRQDNALLPSTTKLFLIPINIGSNGSTDANHWSLVAIRIFSKTRWSSSYIDSIRKSGDNNIDVIRAFVADYMRTETNVLNSNIVQQRADIAAGVPTTTVQTKTADPTVLEYPPEQRNESDCGVFMLMFLEHLALGQPFRDDLKTFSQESVDVHRYRIALSLITGRYIPWIAGSEKTDWEAVWKQIDTTVKALPPVA